MSDSAIAILKFIGMCMLVLSVLRAVYLNPPNKICFYPLTLDRVTSAMLWVCAVITIVNLLTFQNTEAHVAIMISFAYLSFLLSALPWLDRLIPAE